LPLQDVIVGERRFQYEAEVKKNPLNYDSWFDYIRLEEAAGDHDKIREVCSRMIPHFTPLFHCLCACCHSVTSTADALSAVHRSNVSQFISHYKQVL